MKKKLDIIITTEGHSFRPSKFKSDLYIEEGEGLNIIIARAINIIWEFDSAKIPFKDGYNRKLIYKLASETNVNIEFTSGFDIKYQKEINRILKNEFNKKENIINLDNKNITTIFTDFEAISICGGIKQSIVRSIYNKFYLKNKLASEDIYLAHFFAMEAYKKYGIEFINFCLTLPPLPFRFTNVVRVFTQFEKNKSKEEPILRIAIDKENIFELSLYEDKSKIIIKNSKKELIAYLSIDGMLEPIDKSMMIKPVIKLFLKLCENPLEQIIYFGFTIGKCSFCGAELTDPVSLQYGYGQQCATSNDLVWGK